MNRVHLIGRMSKDPELRTTNSGKEVCRFTLAINRGKRNGEDLGADWPTCVAWGKNAVNISKYVLKGHMIGITGRLHTGSYEKDGAKVHTTEVWIDDHDGVEFLQPRGGDRASNDQVEMPVPEADPVTGFTKVETDELPF